MSAVDLMLLSIAIPFVGAVLILSFGSVRIAGGHVREWLSVITSIALLLTVLPLLEKFMQGASIDYRMVEPIPGIWLHLSIEPLGMMFACIASLLWVVNTIYSIGYMRSNNEKNQTRFYVCFAIAIGSTLGLAFSANLLTLFIFYELLSISTYPLVAHKGNELAKKGARTYLAILMGSSIGFLLLAIIWTWSLAGTLDFRAGGILSEHIGEPVIGILLFLFIYGIGKAALMPLHKWLPAAMVAPTPVSALLHAVAVVKAGVFTVLKVIIYIFGPATLADSLAADWIMYLAGFSIVLASTIALFQDNLKRRLAYSTISQLSYVTIAAILVAPFSIMAAALHIAVHAFGKITLFFAAGSIYTATHKTEISQLKGIGRQMPWTMGAFAIGALSMIGIPPAAGFLSKWYLLMGTFQTQEWFVFGVIIISTLLNAAYFLPILYTAFIEKADDPIAQGTMQEAPLPIVIALTITAGLTLLLFFLPDIPLQLINGLPGVKS
ncbi:MAG: monovalent cation/H+ antiporter subunit D family protein [Gammaproteobacteria bacterium]|nr:monovalent cation/H+ antiporter subunit D family protein [Gammaproteobacteria bacterium]